MFHIMCMLERGAYVLGYAIYRVTELDCLNWSHCQLLFYSLSSSVHLLFNDIDTYYGCHLIVVVIELVFACYNSTLEPPY